MIGWMMSSTEAQSWLRAQTGNSQLWSNEPGYRYPAHSHSYDKLLYCVEGSVTFELQGRSVELRAGDHLQIPAETSHSATVGPEGVTCAEGHRS
jgi:quercetin dioxygenase-like cupin family protein